MSNTHYIRTFKYTVYALLLLALYVIQTVPGLFVIFGVKPIWVVPAAIAIAMMEDELIGGIYGALAGLLCDLGGFALFGFKGFWISFFCICSGLLIKHLMHCNLRSCALFTLMALMVTGSMQHFFTLGIHGIEDSWSIYVYSVLPTIAYSLAITPLMFFAVRALHRKFEHVIEGEV